jgi:hypothetical protein
LATSGTAISTPFAFWSVFDRRIVMIRPRFSNRRSSTRSAASSERRSAAEKPSSTIARS